MAPEASGAGYTVLLGVIIGGDGLQGGTWLGGAGAAALLVGAASPDWGAVWGGGR